MSGDVESTAALIVQIQQGEQRAREALVARCRPALQRWARGRLPRYCRDLAETEDLVQVALMRAMERIEQFEPQREGAFLAYLRTILMNAVKNEIRRTDRRPATNPLEDLPAEGPSVVDALVSEEALAAYERALESLSLTQRQAVVLRLEFGLSYPEIALELDLASADAARMQVARGVARIAEAMT